MRRLVVGLLLLVATPAAAQRTLAIPRFDSRVDVQRVRGRQGEDASHDGRDGHAEQVEHVVDDRDLVADEIGDAHGRDDAEHERIAQMVPGRR